MSKAEERALEVYPIESHEMYDDLYRQRNAYVKGYQQAEKDLELTWEDIQKIDVLIYAVLDEEKYKRYYTQDRDGDFYEEVLKRFKERKEL
jgi:hypothetical protein